MYKTLTICSLLLSLYACKDSRSYSGLQKQNLQSKDFQRLEVNIDSLKTISIDINDIDNKIELSDIIDSTFIVKLETKSDNIIGRIDEIKIFNNRIYISDITLSKSIYVFKLDGTYICKIGDNGKGPGEYLRPDGFDIDKKNNEVLVSCHALRKILRYDLKGNFIGDIELKVGHLDFKILNNGTIALLGGDQGNYHLNELQDKIVYIINRKGEILSYGPNYDNIYKDVRSLPSANLMARNDQISYCFKFSDTIYSVNNNAINALYHIDFGKNKLNRDKLKGKSTMEFSKEVKNRSNQYAYSMGTHFETYDYLFLRYSYKDQDHVCFYDKKQLKTFVGQPINSDRIICGTNIIGSYKEYFIEALPSAALIGIEEMIGNLQDPQIYDQFLSDLEIDGTFNVKEEDNPWLFFYKF